jgi:hypothetical protein
MRRVGWLLPSMLVGATALFPPLLPLRAQALSAQSQGPEQTAAFDRADRRARRLIASVRCAQQIAEARSQGLFGPADSLGGSGQCVLMEGRFVGVFMDVDTQFTRATRFAAVDLHRHARRIAPLDTAATLAVARAEWAAQVRGAQAFSDADRPYAPLSFRFDGDSIEVWLFPVAVLRGRPPTVGGERGFVFAPDGRTLAREIDAFAAYRSFTVSDTGTFLIPSRENTVPMLSELVLANLVNGLGRTVAIDMTQVSSTLVGRGAQAVWMQRIKKP